MANAHKFDKAKFEEKREAKENLEKPHKPPNGIPGLSERVYALEKIVGIETIIE